MPSPFGFESFDGTLGAAFEPQLTSRPRSSTSTSSSSSLSFDLSSTDDEAEFDSPSHDTSWSSDTRDPLSASAKPIESLKLYSLPDHASPSRRASASPPDARTSRNARVLAHLDSTPNPGHTSDDETPRGGVKRLFVRPSPVVSRQLFEDTITTAMSEEEFWDKVLSEAIDNANGSLDLSYVTSPAH